MMLVAAPVRHASATSRTGCAQCQHDRQHSTWQTHTRALYAVLV
jgi:hypothetical protein